MTAAETTQVHPTRARAARHDAALDVVSTVTGAVPVQVTVTAVVVTQGHSPFLAATLDAVAAQERAPDDVVVVDVDTARSTGLHTDLTLGGARFVAAGGVRSFGAAVDAALAAVGAPAVGWLWLLHDDSAPAPDALARLLRAVEHSSAVAVAGCKQRRWPVDRAGAPLEPGSGTGLLGEVGYTVSPLGRRMTGIDRTEIDQGQHDAREDVLAVGLAGALVRRAVWTELGGTDPEVGAFGDSLDLCRRARLAGHRVVVVPEAVVHHAQASLLGLRAHGGRLRGLRASAYARRRVQLYQRLVFAPLALVPLAMLAMVLWAPFAAMYRLALKRPGQARDEIAAPLVTAFRVVPLVRARRRTARTVKHPRRVLRPLLGTWREVVAERRDVRLSRAEAQRNRWAPSELERAELRRIAGARRTGLALVTLAVVGLAVVLFGSWQGVLAAGGRVVGGALLPAPGTLADLAEAATSGWVRDGLGAAAPADPFLLPLTALTALTGGSVQAAVNALVVTALPLAALGGWYAAGAVVRSPWARAAGALAWVAAPSFLASLGSGRLGAVVAHLALPWVLVALLRAVGVHARDLLDLPEVRTDPHSGRQVPTAIALRAGEQRRGSLGALGAAGLLLAVAVCGAPVLLPLAVVILLVAVLVAPRHRRYLLVAPLPALAVAAPFWAHVVATWSDGGWRLLLAEPGAPVVPAGAPDGLELLFGLPGDAAGTGLWFGRWLADADGAAGLLAAYGPWVPGGFVLVLATVALLRASGAGGVRLAWFGAALGLAAAILAVATTVAGATGADGEPAPVTGWSGPGQSVLLLGLGAAALRAVDRSHRRRAADGGSAAGEELEEPEEREAGGTASAWRPRVGSGAWTALAVVALLLPATTLTSWSLLATSGAGDRVADLRADAEPVVPAVGQQVQAPPRAATVLQLGRDGAGVVEYTLLHADGSRLQDSSTVVQARAAGLVPAPDRPAAGLLEAVVADLAVGTSPDLVGRLAQLGVGAVQVPAGGDPELATTLDLVEGLTRVTEDGTLVWRVQPDGPPSGWASVHRAAPSAEAPYDAVGSLDAGGAEASGRVDAAEEGRTLVVAAAADPGWTATVDGRRAEPVDAGGLQAFAVGPDGGRVEVRYDWAYREVWLFPAGAVVLVFALLALPVRRRGRGA